MSCSISQTARHCSLQQVHMETLLEQRELTMARRPFLISFSAFVGESRPRGSKGNLFTTPDCTQSKDRHSAQVHIQTDAQLHIQTDTQLLMWKDTQLSCELNSIMAFVL